MPCLCWMLTGTAGTGAGAGGSRRGSTVSVPGIPELGSDEEGGEDGETPAGTARRYCPDSSPACRPNALIKVPDAGCSRWICHAAPQPKLKSCCVLICRRRGSAASVLSQASVSSALAAAAAAAAAKEVPTDRFKSFLAEYCGMVLECLLMHCDLCW